MPERNRKIAILLENVSKSYFLHHEKPTFIENLIKKNRRNEFIAMDKISLTIYQGEKIGIIGPNGAGKTTLLKIISGITTPDEGIVRTRGRIVSLVDLEAGFHPDLTGSENIYLNGLLIGMSKFEVNKVFQQIVDFADIGQFIDEPLYTYSQGMKLRLGFSVAVHANPDILILDEVIAAGDEDFQKKSGDKIEEFFKQGKTILVVTHWREFIEMHCDRVIEMAGGKLKI